VQNDKPRTTRKRLEGAPGTPFVVRIRPRNVTQSTTGKHKPQKRAGQQAARSSRSHQSGGKDASSNAHLLSIATMKTAAGGAAAGAANQPNIPFPRKLFDLIEDEPNSLVEWSPRGDSFFIRDPDEFCAQVLPKYFRHTKLTSFQRQLNLYGFRRITKGENQGAYFHSDFSRSHPEKVDGIRRVVRKGATAQAQAQARAQGGGRAEQQQRKDSIDEEDSDDAEQAAPTPSPSRTAAQRRRGGSRKGASRQSGKQGGSRGGKQAGRQPSKQLSRQVDYMRGGLSQQLKRQHSLSPQATFGGYGASNGYRPPRKAQAVRPGAGMAGMPFYQNFAPSHVQTTGLEGGPLSSYPDSSSSSSASPARHASSYPPTPSAHPAFMQTHGHGHAHGHYPPPPPPGVAAPPGQQHVHAMHMHGATQGPGDMPEPLMFPAADETVHTSGGPPSSFPTYGSNPFTTLSHLPPGNHAGKHFSPPGGTGGGSSAMGFAKMFNRPDLDFQQHHQQQVIGKTMGQPDALGRMLSSSAPANTDYLIDPLGPDLGLQTFGSAPKPGASSGGFLRSTSINSEGLDSQLDLGAVDANWGQEDPLAGPIELGDFDFDECPFPMESSPFMET